MPGRPGTHRLDLLDDIPARRAAVLVDGHGVSIGPPVSAPDGRHEKADGDEPEAKEEVEIVRRSVLSGQQAEVVEHDHDHAHAHGAEDGPPEPLGARLGLLLRRGLVPAALGLRPGHR